MKHLLLLSTLILSLFFVACDETTGSDKEPAKTKNTTGGVTNGVPTGGWIDISDSNTLVLFENNQVIYISYDSYDSTITTDDAVSYNLIKSYYKLNATGDTIDYYGLIQYVPYSGPVPPSFWIVAGSVTDTTITDTTVTDSIPQGDSLHDRALLGDWKQDLNEDGMTGTIEGTFNSDWTYTTTMTITSMDDGEGNTITGDSLNAILANNNVVNPDRGQGTWSTLGDTLTTTSTTNVTDIQLYVVTDTTLIIIDPKDNTILAEMTKQ